MREARKVASVAIGQGEEQKGGHCVRGFCIATGQHFSFCGCAWDLALGGSDHMEDEDQDREQIEVRAKVEARQTEEEDKTKKQQTLKHVMTCA